jgi:hypothetical protein
MSQALPWAFGYYENSVAMRVSPCRRSRFYLYETLSPFRCPVRFLQPIRYRSLAAESVHQYLLLWFFRAVQHCTSLRQRRFRYATTDGLLHRWKLGFKQFSFHHADRTRSASPYISSGLSAFSLCYFPLCLSTLGKVSVLEGHLLSTFCSFGSNLIHAETAHLDVANIIEDHTGIFVQLCQLLGQAQVTDCRTQMVGGALRDAVVEPRQSATALFRSPQPALQRSRLVQILAASTLE